MLVIGDILVVLSSQFSVIGVVLSFQCAQVLKLLSSFTFQVSSCECKHMVSLRTQFGWLAMQRVSPHRIPAVTPGCANRKRDVLPAVHLVHRGNPFGISF